MSISDRAIRIAGIVVEYDIGVDRNGRLSLEF